MRCLFTNPYCVVNFHHIAEGGGGNIIGIIARNNHKRDLVMHESLVLNMDFVHFLLNTSYIDSLSEWLLIGIAIVNNVGVLWYLMSHMINGS